MAQMGQDEPGGSGQAGLARQVSTPSPRSLRICSLLDNCCQEGAVGEVSHSKRLIDQNDYSVFHVGTEVQTPLDEFEQHSSDLWATVPKAVPGQTMSC